MSDSPEDPELLRIKINQETARIPWKELQRFFAQGRVIFVAPELDLVETALLAARDQTDSISALVAEERIAKVSDEQARRWLKTDALLWTLVVRPWVFVQAASCKEGPESR